MESESCSKCFRVEGKVQKVMFRQTLTRAMLKYGLKGGASNRKDDVNAVDVTLCGDAKKIKELMDRVGNGRPINDWGATATRVIEKEYDPKDDWKEHKVTTENVDTFNWNPNVKMFI